MERPCATPDRRWIPERARIVDRRAGRRTAGAVTIALHKPRGLSSPRDAIRRGGRRSTTPSPALDAHVAPVGRLDFAIERTAAPDQRHTPGGLAHRSGQRRRPRMYLVTVRGRVTADGRAALERRSRARRREAARASGDASARRRAARVTSSMIARRRKESRDPPPLRRGRPRGDAPHRVRIGGLVLDALAPGAWRIIPRHRACVPRRFWSGRAPRRTRGALATAERFTWACSTDDYRRSVVAACGPPGPQSARARPHLAPSIPPTWWAAGGSLQLLDAFDRPLHELQHRSCRPAGALPFLICRPPASPTRPTPSQDSAADDVVQCRGVGQGNHFVRIRA